MFRAFGLSQPRLRARNSDSPSLRVQETNQIRHIQQARGNPCDRRQAAEPDMGEASPTRRRGCRRRDGLARVRHPDLFPPRPPFLVAGSGLANEGLGAGAFGRVGASNVARQREYGCVDQDVPLRPARALRHASAARRVTMKCLVSAFGEGVRPDWNRRQRWVRGGQSLQGTYGIGAVSDMSDRHRFCFLP